MNQGSKSNRLMLQALRVSNESMLANSLTGPVQAAFAQNNADWPQFLAGTTPVSWPAQVKQVISPWPERLAVKSILETRLPVHKFAALHNLIAEQLIC